MKKLAATLLLLISASAYAYIPVYNVDISGDNSVKLYILNDSDTSQECSYKVSWFEGPKFKKYFGKVSMLAGEEKVFKIQNDPYVKIFGLKAKVDCE